jgi:hypothetical protein
MEYRRMCTPRVSVPPPLPPFSSPLSHPVDKKDHPRAALEAHAASEGHTSVKAYLRALTPQRLDAAAFIKLRDATLQLTADEAEVAAALFFSFAADPKDWSVFHPSLLEKDTFKDSLKPGEMLPSSLVPWMGCESR